MTILEARKTMPKATAAAVSRERDGTGFRVHVSLMEGAPSDLDVAGEIVAVFVADEVGKDLADAFGDKNVIILS